MRKVCVYLTAFFSMFITVGCKKNDEKKKDYHVITSRGCLFLMLLLAIASCNRDESMGVTELHPDEDNLFIDTVMPKYIQKNYTFLNDGPYGVYKCIIDSTDIFYSDFMFATCIDIIKKSEKPHYITPPQIISFPKLEYPDLESLNHNDTIAIQVKSFYIHLLGPTDFGYNQIPYCHVEPYKN